MKNICITLIFTITISVGAQSPIPEYLEPDLSIDRAAQKIVQELELDGNFDVGEDGIEQISLAVIDLTNGKKAIGGMNMDNFIYPASVYKMYVAAEVLHQIYEGEYELTTPYVVRSPNDVDKSKEILFDPRPLLRDGDTVTINYLLDLMITRSDNSAANCLIDIATRPRINEMIANYGWQGSEVTRKFLSRRFEDPGYEKVKGTETCALHAADFMYRIETGQLFNPWVSMQMKTLLGRQLDKSKLAQGLPKEAMFYHKTGWWSYWTNDVGIVDGGNIKYIIALFTPVREEQILPKMKLISERVYSLMRERAR
jgi:beta-lactamase class A